MPSCRSLIAALCLFCLPLLLLAQKPEGARLISKTDSRQNNPSMDTLPPIPREIGGKTYDQWKADLSHTDPSVRATAITVIVGFRERATDCVSLLVKRTYDQDASPRAKAVMALGMLPISDGQREHVVKALGDRIGNDSEAVIRYQAAKILPKFGKEVRAVTLNLIKGLGSSSTWELREACIAAIIAAGVDEKTGPETRVTDALILRTKPGSYGEPSRQVRLEAIIALGALGRPHSPQKLQQVLGALRDHYRSSDKVIRIWSHVSLMALEDKIEQKDLKMIVEYLGDPDREVRAQAVTALGAMRDKADKHIKDICDMLRREKESMVQTAACNALGHMRNKGDNVLKALIRLTELDDRGKNDVVLAACNALMQIHVTSPDVMTALNKVKEHHALDDQQKYVVQAIIEQIQKPLPDEDKPREQPKVEKGVGAGRR